MRKLLESALPPLVSPLDHAFFFDFDGTLAPLGVPKLHDPQLDVRLVPALKQIQQKSHGALAIVTGRDIPEVDLLFAPFQMAVSGSHGAQVRCQPDGKVETLADITGMDAAYQALSAWVARTPRTYLTRKEFTTVLDLRTSTALLKEAEAAVRHAIATHPALTLLHGRGSIEVKAANTHKGTAVQFFQQHAPFEGRIPVFAGDDVADESAFEVVNAHPHGVSIKVGPGPTGARYRVADDLALRDWIVHVAQR